MKTRDLFAGCFVAIAPHDDLWLVSLIADGQRTLTMQTYQELPDALEAAHEWALMLSDETEISPNAEAAGDTFRVILARMALGDQVGLPETIDEVTQRESLRTWFEREMGKHRSDEE